MTESTTQAAVRVEAQRLGVWLWRNNSGVLKDARGVPVRFGLGNDSTRINAKVKSSDLVGIQERTGRFVAIEIKPRGWRGVRTDHERAQRAFHDIVRTCGGIAGFVTSVEELRELLQCSK